MNGDLDILRHELAHALTNLAWGATRVVIQRAADGDGMVAVPHWPTDAITLEQWCAGLLGGRLHVVGVNNADDEAKVRRFSGVVDLDALAEQVRAIVQPELDAVNDDALAQMLTLLDENGGIEITGIPRQLH